ncbi:endo-chitosanase [Penicillium macrosclerotiorum]|uniref:endo-chitosanase n=1 Tax=Penicillium macrosclerotiorum TaxID=303699 RepID=UPI00254711AC|nr:endo-chitosanase [Penicillium macrosclerotiorum]KAJ5698037.1 endo-chitosanase [Penicillium macrosclerotiorum]
MHSSNLLLLALAGAISAYDLPSELEQIYEAHKAGSCNDILTGGFSDGSSGRDVSYCGDLDGAIFLHSEGNGGAYADMDVDCDGADNGAGACSNDPSGQGETAFKDEVSQYGISDLNANIHPYVVFGNSGSSPSFDPQQYGMEPLSVMAVVCNGNLHYGVWGDTNGGTSTGEASISLAQLCFPDENLTGDNGHGDKDVLYIGFTGQDAVPGSTADWDAESSATFEDSIKTLGDQLVAKLTSASA